MNVGIVNRIVHRPGASFGFAFELDETDCPTKTEHYIPTSFVTSLSLRAGDRITFRVHVLKDGKTRAMDVQRDGAAVMEDSDAEAN